jgi:subtilisin-like proprotein convertase family protein
MNTVFFGSKSARIWALQTTIISFIFLVAAASTVAQTTFSNATPIVVSDGAASPYPSNVTVSALSGTVTGVSVTLNNFSHTNPDDVDVMLVAPNGNRFVLMSDVGGPTDVTGLNLTFSDGGTTQAPDGGPLTSSNYQPTNVGTGDTFPPLAAPVASEFAAPAGSATFFNRFNGIAPNGTWSLYVFDDNTGETGNISGGWSISITTNGGIPSATLIISEFRVRGPNGANDEFIEIYNPSNSDHTVVAASGTGYGVAASDGTTRCSIPNGTVIPARGHYLCVNSVGYSLASYPAGNGTTATGDATYTTDIPDNAGIAIFNNNTGGGSYVLANRFDAVGSTSEANTLYKEGGGYPALTPFSIDYSFARKAIGGSVAIPDTIYPTLPFPQDTDNNASDFYFVDTNGTSAGAGQRLGAPGPENLSSPISAIGQPLRELLDPCVSLASPPNKVRDFTSDPANNSTFGTLDFRRTFINQSGVPMTRLRFRILKLTTFPAPSGISDLRPRTSTAVVVTVDRAPCGSGTSNVTVQGTTLEQPPSQPNGGGFNSTMSAGTVTLATPLANGASIDLRFLFGIQQTGAFAIAIVVEALPRGGAYWIVQGDTDPSAGDRPEAENSATAAGVSVSGKVFDSAGAPLARATVQMTDMNGVTRTTRTNTFGNYNFDGVRAGELYTFEVSAKSLRFSPQVVQINDSVTDLNFSPNQNFSPSKRE